MGASLVFLDEPNKNIEWATGDDSRATFACGEMQGWRLNMVSVAYSPRSSSLDLRWRGPSLPCVDCPLTCDHRDTSFRPKKSSCQTRLYLTLICAFRRTLLFTTWNLKTRSTSLASLTAMAVVRLPSTPSVTSRRAFAKSKSSSRATIRRVSAKAS